MSLVRSEGADNGTAWPKNDEMVNKFKNSEKETLSHKRENEDNTKDNYDAFISTMKTFWKVQSEVENDEDLMFLNEVRAALPIWIREAIQILANSTGDDAFPINVIEEKVAELHKFNGTTQNEYRMRSLIGPLIVQLSEGDLGPIKHTVVDSVDHYSNRF